MKRLALLKGLYVLSDEHLTPDETVFEQIKRVLESGVSVVQYRHKSAQDEESLLICKALLTLCHEYDALFIIDDRVQLAHAIDADGVHIGMEDTPYEEARALLGEDKIIGVSCYGDIERALHYEALGADYVAFGSFFASPTKPHAGLVPLSVLEEAKERLHVPICAIGGITAQTIAQVAHYDIAMYAIVSAVYADDCIEANLKTLQAFV